MCLALCCLFLANDWHSIQIEWLKAYHLTISVSSTAIFLLMIIQTEQIRSRREKEIELQSELKLKLIREKTNQIKFRLP